MGILRKLAAGLFAVVGVGLVLGAVSRVLMRMVALAAGTPGEFTWSGSLGICVIFAAAMLPGALLAAFAHGWVRWALPVAGALFLCIPAVGVASEEVGHTAGFSFAQWAGVAVAGAAVFATVALLPVATMWLVGRLIDGGRGPSRQSQRVGRNWLGRAVAAGHPTGTAAVVAPPAPRSDRGEPGP